MVHSLHSGAFLRAAARPQDYPKCRYKADRHSNLSVLPGSGAPGSLHQICRSCWQRSLKRWISNGPRVLALTAPSISKFGAIVNFVTYNVTCVTRSSGERSWVDCFFRWKQDCSIFHE